MSDRIPIFLPLFGVTVHLSERVLAEVGAAATEVLDLAATETRTVTADGIRGVLLAGLEGLDTNAWAELPPEKREAYLLWVFGCLDGLILRLLK